MTPAPRSASLAGYLLLQVALPSLLVNVAINFVVGRALFVAARVPLWGQLGIAGDTLVGAFFIGFFTLLTVAPMARRQARAGRVRGWGRRAAWLGWARRRPLLRAVGFGVVSSLALGGPLVVALAAAGVAALPLGAFLALKVGFSGVAGVITAVATTLYTILPEADVADDPRWCRDPAAPVGGVVYPCDYIDKGGLAVTDRARGCSGTPTWQLVVRGALDPAHVRSALADVVTRYPSLTTKVQSLDGVPPLATRFRYAHDGAFALDDIFTVVDVAGDPAALAALTRELHNRHLDLFTDFPLTLTLARDGADSCRLLFRQHHALADGRAFIALLVDFAACLEAARAGRRPSPQALAPVGRRGELEALGLSRWRRAWYTAAGYRWLAATLFAALRWPVVPLLQNRSNDYRGDNGTVHWTVGDAALAEWNAARKRLGASLTALLTGALFVANQRWHRALGLPLGHTRCGIIMETRPRAGTFLSFANHLSTLDAVVELDRAGDTAHIVRDLHAQLTRQRDRHTPIKRLLCERQLVRLMTLEQMQRFVFESRHPAYHLSVSNLIALDFPSLGGAGWSVDDVLVTTPVTPRAGIVLTVLRYRGRVTFNFNYKASAATRAETEALCGHFQAALAELV